MILEHVDRGRVHIPGELTGPLRAVDKRSELVVASFCPAEPAKRLLAVGECEFHRVGVEVLSVIVTSHLASTHPVAGNRPGVHEPTTLVDLVDEVVDHVPGAYPEQVEFAELELRN